MARGKQARITNIQWQWNSSVGVGVALASIVLSRSVILHAIVPSGDLRGISCAEASNPKLWVAAHATSPPGGYGSPMAYHMRYGVIHPDEARVRNAQSVRLKCEFPVAPTIGGHVTLRHSRWRISRIPIRRGVAEQASRAMATTVTVCIPYVWGVGSGSLTTRKLVEFLAWYRLLGASQIVLFDNVEPELERRTDARFQATQQRRAIDVTAAAFPDHFAVVRGLCWHDTMLQASPHQNCQALAANMCLDSARATSTTSHNFVSSLDLDEFLVPPLPLEPEGREAAGAGEGALIRLAARIQAGNRGEDQSYVQRSTHGTGSCIKFADVYFVPPDCGESVAPPSHLDLVDFAFRGTPDNFEAGPSSLWRQREWGPSVRAKLLVDASTLHVNDCIGIHQCCGRSADGCAAVEHVPLEQWHVRHLRASRNSSAGNPCYNGDLSVTKRTVTGPQIVNLSHSHADNGHEILRHEPLPRPWAAKLGQRAAAYRRELERTDPDLWF